MSLPDLCYYRIVPSPQFEKLKLTLSKMVELFVDLERIPQKLTGLSWFQSEISQQPNLLFGVCSSPQLRMMIYLTSNQDFEIWFQDLPKTQISPKELLDLDNWSQKNLEINLRELGKKEKHILELIRIITGKPPIPPREITYQLITPTVDLSKLESELRSLSHH